MASGQNRSSCLVQVSRVENTTHPERRTNMIDELNQVGRLNSIQIARLFRLYTNSNKIRVLPNDKSLLNVFSHFFLDLSPEREPCSRLFLAMFSPHDTHSDGARGGTGVGAVDDVHHGKGVLNEEGPGASNGGVGSGGPAGDVAALGGSGEASAGELDLVTGEAARGGGVAGNVTGHTGSHAGRDLQDESK